MRKAKSITLLLISGLMLFICVSGCLKLLSKINFDKQKISILAYEVGGLDNNGVYKETKESIYTKDLIECYGLEIKPNFDSQVRYQVYYYDQNEIFLESSEVMKSDNYNKVVPLAKYCRVVIYPLNDISISKIEISKYAKQVKVYVDKAQKFIYKENLYNEDITKQNQEFSETLIDFVENEGGKCSTIIDTKQFIKLHIVVSNKVNTIVKVCFADSELNIVETQELTIPVNTKGLNYEFEISVPKTILKCGIVYNGTGLIEVYGE